MNRVFFYLLFFFSLNTFSQQQKEIKSVQLYPEGNEIGLPVIRLNQQQPLVLEFDYLGDNAPYFDYKIEHYSADWKKTSINPLQYIKGFNTGSVSDFEFSFNTDQLYTHYEFEFPNQQTSFKVSGNYVITVFERDSKRPVLEERFYVTEQLVQIKGNIENASGIGQLESHHQIDFAVDYKGLNANAPREEFQVNVQQNFRPDNRLVDLKPSRYTDDILYFNNQFNQSFAAGNEYRWFNIKSTRYLTENIADVIHRKDSTTHVYLIPDLLRKKQDFITYNDFNGQYVIDHQEGTRPDLDGDYVYVHFSLKETEALRDKDIYVYGELTDWEIKDEYKLTINPRQNFLEAVLYLKQGNYDYMYVTKEAEKLSAALTEGNFYRTQNNYTVFVYYKPFGSRFNRLVGVQQFQSRF